jgi:hypothetical protein
MKNTDERVEARLRVVSETIRRWDYTHCKPADGPTQSDHIGEVLEVKAIGEWRSLDEDGPHTFPVSLHITVYPGCGVIPVIGDHICVTIERDKAAQSS